MLDLAQIQAQYPVTLRPFGRFILREYLQHKLLQLIYDSPLGARFIFLGGTCLRIVHGNRRFSEDLDFDNTGPFEAHCRSISVAGRFIRPHCRRVSAPSRCGRVPRDPHNSAPMVHNTRHYHCRVRCDCPEESDTTVHE